MRTLMAVGVVLMLATPALAAKPCDELKAEIEAKLKAKGVEGYSLEIVANDDVKDQTVVGSCDGGTKKIVYKREK
ncbi:MAG: DUF1161 domain-containing protein [Candidatus Rokuibacteriota bacterium]|nr:MAG: DUF1161 domain-containing protein [Candidatus Rokubacteria bacterium]